MRDEPKTAELPILVLLQPEEFKEVRSRLVLDTTCHPLLCGNDQAKLEAYDFYYCMLTDGYSHRESLETAEYVTVLRIQKKGRYGRCK